MDSGQAQANHDIYVEKYKESLERDHFGRVALMRDGQVVIILNDFEDAYDVGCEQFGLGNFSLVKIGAQPVHLGVHTLAVS